MEKTARKETSMICYRMTKSRRMR